MTAPVVGVGDGALGFWKALREVFPDTREQRCWFHVRSNVLAALPKSAHSCAKAALAEIYSAEDRDHALKAVKAFEADYSAKWPKAVAKSPSTGSTCVPPIRWSTFATVRLRQRITKGPGSRAVGIAMAFKLIESAQARWRAVDALTSSLWSVPAPGSRRARSSNEPTNQEVLSKSRKHADPQVLTIPHDRQAAGNAGEDDHLL
jgi:putative transposase